MTDQDQAVYSRIAVELGSEVWTTASANGGNLWKASEAVWATLSNEQRHALGIWALVQAERLALRANRPAVGHVTSADHESSADGGLFNDSAGGGHCLPDTQRPSAPSGRDWLSFYMKKNPMDLVVSVGNWERKRVGDLTAEDCERMALYYSQTATTLEAKARGYKRLAGKIHTTLEAAYEKLGTLDKRFIHEEVGYKEEDKAA